MIPNNFIASDYCGFDGDKISVYYGYEETDELTGDWCFTVKKNGKEVFRATNERLLALAGNESPEAMLIAGLSLYLNK